MNTPEVVTGWAFTDGSEPTTACPSLLDALEYGSGPICWAIEIENPKPCRSDIVAMWEGGTPCPMARWDATDTLKAWALAAARQIRSRLGPQGLAMLAELEALASSGVKGPWVREVAASLDARYLGYPYQGVLHAAARALLGHELHVSSWFASVGLCELEGRYSHKTWLETETLQERNLTTLIREASPDWRREA